VAIYRCSACGLVRENTNAPGSKIACEKCGVQTTLFATTFYVEKLVERYVVALRELEALQAAEEHQDEAAPESPREPVERKRLLEELHNTNMLATAAQHQPIQNWFAAKNIAAIFDYGLVDTTGFFDEAAKSIGDQYDLLSSAIEQVRFAYRKDITWLRLDTSKKDPQVVRAVNAAFRQLYSQSFFSRYFVNKKSGNIEVGMQPAQPVRAFFEGGWLEWYVFVEMLKLCAERNIAFSCARSVKIEFPNEEKRELDIAFLLRERFPIFIECKSGEFRADIDKYIKLTKKLGVDKSQFILCGADLNDQEAAGMSAMYPLTIVNLASLKTHLSALI
jgi:hypothetical protein